MKNQHMKNLYLVTALGLFIASCGPTTVVETTTYHPAPTPVEDVSYQSFYDQLSPYGNWINYPGYGYVWMPNAGPDFQPYSTNGNWIYTDAGWTWSSNYSWGWAPFHYGRWFYENGYGWMWVPGNEWAPAWVSWRGGGDYYGWAPMGPWITAEMAMSNYNPPSNYWNFVPRQYMGNSNWHNYYVGGEKNVTIINNTTIINNYSGSDKARYAYAPGPNPEEVSRYSGTPVRPVQIRQANTPGERVLGTQYVIYQPHVTSPATATRADVSGRPATVTPAPARYESFNNVRPSAQYPSYNPQTGGSTQQNNAAAGSSRPVNNREEYTQPVNGTGPGAGNHPSPAVTQNPAYTPTGNASSRPTYTPASPANPPTNNPANGSINHVNNPRPSTQGQANNPQPALVNAHVNNHPTPAPSNPDKLRQQASSHPQNVNPPANNPHNPNNPHPTPKTDKQPKKQPPVEQPKPKETPSGGN
jgi:hypothetical protein